MTELKNADGVVSSWDADSGFGIIEAAETPGGCWVHCSSIDAAGRTSLHAGERVWFVYVETKQDGYDFRAESVRIPGLPRAESHFDSDAYASSLTITLDEPPPA